MSNCKKEVEFVKNYFFPIFEEIGGDYIKISLDGHIFAMEKASDNTVLLLTPTASIEIDHNNIAKIQNGYLEYRRGRKKRIFDYYKYVEWIAFIQLAQKQAREHNLTTYELTD